MLGSHIPVSDLLSNFNDQMATAARIIGRSKHRRAIFRTVYHGKKEVKTIKEIMQATGLSQVHTLKEGGKMASLLFDKVPGGYKKKKDFSSRYKKILELAEDRKKLNRLATKVSPAVTAKGQKVNISFPAPARNARVISIDEIESFSKVGAQTKLGMKTIREKTIKRAFAKIIGETGSFKDWGGEKSDLYTTRLRFGGRRTTAAIAFKGRATQGKLMPAKMGKNGDQISRLFEEPAHIFLVVYGGQIDSSILSQMQAYAIGVALDGQRVYFGVVDGTDLGRIAAAYPDCF